MRMFWQGQSANSADVSLMFFAATRNITASFSDFSIEARNKADVFGL